MDEMGQVREWIRDPLERVREKKEERVSYGLVASLIWVDPFSSHYRVNSYPVDLQFLYGLNVNSMLLEIQGKFSFGYKQNDEMKEDL